MRDFLPKIETKIRALKNVENFRKLSECNIFVRAPNVSGASLYVADQFSLINSHSFSPARQFGATFTVKGGKDNLKTLLYSHKSRREMM